MVQAERILQAFGDGWWSASNTIYKKTSATEEDHRILSTLLKGTNPWMHDCFSVKLHNLLFIQRAHGKRQLNAVWCDSLLNDWCSDVTGLTALAKNKTISGIVKETLSQERKIQQKKQTPNSKTFLWAQALFQSPPSFPWVTPNLTGWHTAWGHGYTVGQRLCFLYCTLLVSKQSGQTDPLLVLIG